MRLTWEETLHRVCRKTENQCNPFMLLQTRVGFIPPGKPVSHADETAEKGLVGMKTRSLPTCPEQDYFIHRLK